MKLSVIIPCFNEGPRIREVLAKVRAVDVAMEIIVVDDGSTDDTGAILDSEYAQDEAITVHHLPANAGKGMAIRVGLEYVTGDIVIIQDADMEYDPQQYPEILRPFADPNVQVVYGSRFLGEISGMRLPNRIANHLLTAAANVLFTAHITDEATCYKAFRADLIRSLPLKCTRFEFCPEVTAKVRKRGIKIVEVPIRYMGRAHAQGKKVRWTDGFVAMWTLLKYRFMD